MPDGPAGLKTFAHAAQIADFFRRTEPHSPLAYTLQEVVRRGRMTWPELIAALGGGTVEGYPENAASVPAGFLFNGALSTYEKLGFTRNRKIGKHRWVVTKLVKPGSA